MALIGGRDTRDNVVNTGVDAVELRKLQLQDGTTYDAIVAELTGALTALNASFTADPFYSSVASFTNDVEVSYRMGSNPSFDEFTEYSTADSARSESDGHMLPLKAYDFKLSWTWDYMRKATFSRVQDDIAVAIGAAADLRRKKMLSRLLARGEDSGAALGLGASGLSPGFTSAVRAASAGNYKANTLVYTPPPFNGKTFSSGHEHYTFAGSSNVTATVVTMMKNLREHGATAPYDLICSETDYDTVKAFADFVPPGDPLVQYGTTTSLAVGAFDNGWSGYLKDSMARVRMVIGWPDNYLCLYKSAGANSPLNPLRVRLPAGENALRVVSFPDPRPGTAPSPAAPLASLVLWTEFGVGVGNRLAGAVNRNNAAWADGAAS